MALPPSGPISLTRKLLKQVNKCQIIEGALRGDNNLIRDLGTTGALLEVLERFVGLEGFSDGFAALVADTIVR